MSDHLLARLTTEIQDSSELNWKTLALKRGDQVTRVGDVEKHIYLVKSGALRAVYPLEGDEQTIRFGYTGSLITSLQSVFTGKPSEIYLEALRKTSLKTLAFTEFEAFIQKETWRMEAYIHLLQELSVQQYEREIDLLTSNPKERLDRLMARSPHVFQEIPSKYIASYLRMSPETLSRLKNGD